MKPNRGLFILILCLLFLGTAAFFYDPLFPMWIILGAAPLPFIIIDALLLCLFTDRLRVERELGGILALGRKAPVKLRLRRTEKSGLLARTIQLFDVYPDSLNCAAFPAKLERRVFRQLPGTASTRHSSMYQNNAAYVFEYSVTPVERGNWEFTGTELLLGSPLGFWRLKVVHPVTSRGKTFPDFRKLASGAELRGVLEQTGVKIVRKRGQGMEFLSLRDYQKGDSIRSLDWRATGRRNKPIVREYQEEQDQQILLLLDSGYRLHRLEENPAVRVTAANAAKNPQLNSPRNPAARSQFDSALEAAMLLSWVALKHGDGVALGCFGTEDRWLPPRKGMSALSGIVQSLYDIPCDSAPSSLFSALENALARLKRRTFIIMISNFREEDGEPLSWILRRIKRRHLLLLVSLKEAEAEHIAERKPIGADEALETAAAFSYLSARRRLYKTWEHLGLLTLECGSHELSSALINRYLNVKSGGLL